MEVLPLEWHFLPKQPEKNIKFYKGILTQEKSAIIENVMNNQNPSEVLYHKFIIQGFVSCKDWGHPSSLKTLTTLRGSEPQLGVKIHTLVVKFGFDYDVYVKTSLLCLYASCGYLGHAHKVFDDIPEKNVVSWTTIISGYIGVGQYGEAIDMFGMLVEMGLRPDSFTIVRVLFACTQLGYLRSGEWIDDYMIEIGMGRNVFVATSLVDTYAKCGNIEKARCVFDGISEKDIVTWSTMIQTYALNGFPKEALDLHGPSLRLYPC